MRRVNIGCGQTPTQGWQNYDNSWSIRLSKVPCLAVVLNWLGIVSKRQWEFISFAKSSGIRWADATRCIPESDHSVEVLYSSHMLEHLDREEAQMFLKEARRVLIHGGIIRIAVPDIKPMAGRYLSDGDCDVFVEGSRLTRRRPRGLVEKLRYLIAGDRGHLWMYDGESLCRCLASAGFSDPRVTAPGSTIIPMPGSLNLRERSAETVYVEAISP